VRPETYTARGTKGELKGEWQAARRSMRKFGTACRAASHMQIGRYCRALRGDPVHTRTCSHARVLARYISAAKR